MMIKLLRSDIYRVLHSKTIYITIVAMLGIATISMMSQTIIVSGMIDPDMQKVIESTKHWGMSEAIIACTMGLSAYSWFNIPMYTIIIGQEFSQGTYKNVFFSGISRREFVTSKLLLMMITIISLFIILFGYVAILGYIKNGLGNISFNGDIIKNLIIASLFYVIISTVYYTLALGIQVSTNSSILAIVFVIIFPFMIQMIQMLTDWNFLNMVNFAATTFRAQTGDLPISEIIKTLSMNAGLLLFTSCASIEILKRKEF